MAHMDNFGYVEVSKGKGWSKSTGKGAKKEGKSYSRRHWLILQHPTGSGVAHIGTTHLYFPQKYIGRWVKLKIEFEEDSK